jgi:uncharacterized protein
MAQPDGTSESLDPESGPSQPPELGQDLTNIGDDECFALLNRQNLGRLAIVRDGRPEIFPVNYAMQGRTITVRTGSGVKLNYASLAHVAFEVEEIDPVTREGWVIEARGFAEEVTDAVDTWSEGVRNAGATPWVAGQHDRYLAISHLQVSGRRISTPTTQ